MANLPFLRRAALKTLALRPGNPPALLRRRSLSSGGGAAADDPPFSPKPIGRTPKPQKSRTRKEEPPESSPGDPERPVESDLPFDFRYSYSETNAAVEPIGFREPPRFSPFGPGRIDRAWTGTSAPAREALDPEEAAAERGRVQGAPLSEEEIAELVERYRHSDCNRQINLGKGGVTHNMLDDIHNHWKRAEAVRIKCLGVPTLDMDNVCFHLEDKSGGKIIYRNINILLLYRGRYYDPKQRPVIPLMLWKPYAPIYPKLVKNVAEGLTFEETKEMRNRGLNSPPLTKLTRNGVYVNVVEKVREAFKSEDVVRIWYLAFLYYLRTSRSSSGGGREIPNQPPHHMHDHKLDILRELPGQLVGMLYTSH
ncbi:CRS2-associated factor 2, mitochondrial isoform X1 [Syzygium oleosum]|uniref:CRS2-associated factor 2, mitochondrial isoform X1 n=1 Tax=Syzygium oleosum TaxID=219896 RepID=UPI0024BB4272|nr:CRS2-associated factor 2, mitochondrial isoform X1 [Syzygium oleosum]